MSHSMRKPVDDICDNKDVDQHAHPRSLISAFDIRCLDSIIPLVSVAEQASLSLTWSEILKTGFLVTWLQCQITASS